MSVEENSIQVRVNQCSLPRRLSREAISQKIVMQTETCRRVGSGSIHLSGDKV